MTLEELLNKCIKKGWKPRGENAMPNSYWVEGNSICWNRGGKASIRELASKESGLWQFCVENGYNQYKKEYRMGYTKYNNKAEYWDEGDYEYYLIEASLKDESELKEFLLSNIVIIDEKNIIKD